MQRLSNLNKWQHVKADEALNLSGAEGRRVRLDVNAPWPVRLWHSDGNGEMTFLALAEGRDVIEFIAPATSSITVEGGEVWVHTFDGEVLSVEVADAVKLTKMVTRRPRNHEMEMMAYEMRRNSEAMYATIYQELRREFAGREQAPVAPTPQPQPAGDAAGDGSQPEPAGVAGDGAGDKPADGGSGKSAAKKG